MNKVSVVVMAGYRKREIDDYRHQLKYYHEKYIERDYKALREFKVTTPSGVVTKPLIQFTLLKLEKVADAGDVVIVGAKKRLESRLARLLERWKGPIRIIDQHEPLTEEMVRAFNLRPKAVAHDSICGNALKAYYATRAFKEKKHALFMACDSPRTSREGIEKFIHVARADAGTAAMVFPIVSMIELPRWRKCFHRKYFFLVNDSDHRFSDSFTTWFTRREGFRVSSMLYANPFKVNANMANTAYGARKMLSREVRRRVTAILEPYGHQDVFKRYFISRDLSIRDCEHILSDVFEGVVRIFPLRDVGSTYDYDGTQSEARVIGKMLEKEAERQL